MSDKNIDPMTEILAAIGAWTMHNCQGNAEMSEEIFRCIIPKFKDRFPHHKLLSNLRQEASEPLLVNPNAPLLTVYLIANQLSVKLPSGEVLFNSDPILLANMLIERGFGLDDVGFADKQQEGDRAPGDEAAIAFKLRMQETFM